MYCRRVIDTFNPELAATLLVFYLILRIFADPISRLDQEFCNFSFALFTTAFTAKRKYI
jgi:hypothetical protein